MKYNPSNHPFKPIHSLDDLHRVVGYIHTKCHELCMQAMGSYLEVAGNIAVFCHSEEEYNYLMGLAKTLTKSSDNSNQKYFEFVEPFVCPQQEHIPGAIYTYLYIRKPSDNSPQMGDIDFVVNEARFTLLKEQILLETANPMLAICERPGWDMIEIMTEDVLPYISTKQMAEKVRVEF